MTKNTAHFYYGNHCGLEEKYDSIAKGYTFTDTVNTVDCLKCLEILMNSLSIDTKSRETEWHEYTKNRIKILIYRKDFQDIVCGEII